MLKTLSSKNHAVLDYLTAFALVAIPFVSNTVNSNHSAVWTLMGAGIFTLLYSLLTNYEWSIRRLIPYTAHLFLDVMQALFLIFSPWLFDFSSQTFSIHVTIGLIELLVVFLSIPKSVTIKVFKN